MKTHNCSLQLRESGAPFLFLRPLEAYSHTQTHTHTYTRRNSLIFLYNMCVRKYTGKHLYKIKAKI